MYTLYDRERCRGENMHLLPCTSTSGETRDARVTILKRNGARASISVYGEDSNRECRWLRRRLAFAAVTLAHGGVPFALDQLPTGSLTGRFDKLELRIRPVNPVNRGSAGEDTSDAANRETNK